MLLHLLWTGLGVEGRVNSAAPGNGGDEGGEGLSVTIPVDGHSVVGKWSLWCFNGAQSGPMKIGVIYLVILK